MFLEFHEFETKYLAGVYKRHWTTIYVEYMLNKAPAQAFTPPAEKFTGKKWTFMYNCTGREKHEVANFYFKNISCNQGKN